ncbi:MAG: four helix bundle protein [Campylobacterales bacterium]|jgi:four helix bundle protein|uniref:four helix bundle protein n=1 Tax=Sulfurovum mangrovi TaxID=2893889 RepID=UPI001769822D|nr:four helix bundle protein [Sulfurovum mangrovi]MBN2250409.1 four helix bundle protein [Campylobacterales bacterium]UFH58991.1 four helix bundle protein [Sulfurovum mangrovi]HEO99244.1 four helix bundle protein [Campylobacterota bacterium]
MSILEEKSYAFSIRIVKCTQYLQDDKKEFVLSKQLIRSGTAVGALIAEAKYAQSKSDFINKLSIAAKEGNETKYWLRLLKDCNYLQEKSAISLLDDIEGLIRILASSIKTAKENNYEK